MILADEDATVALGRRIGERLLPGDVITLVGDLGAGKSCLARGIARGLGIGGRIPSPTFVIVAEYLQGRLPLHHVDLYRLSDPEELIQLGLDELIGGEGVVVVEWPDRAASWFTEAVTVHLQEHGDQREARLEGPTEVVERLLG